MSNGTGSKNDESPNSHRSRNPVTNGVFIVNQLILFAFAFGCGLLLQFGYNLAVAAPNPAPLVVTSFYVVLVVIQVSLPLWVLIATVVCAYNRNLLHFRTVCNLFLKVKYLFVKPKDDQGKDNDGTET
jgi:hypothetical protein